MTTNAPQTESRIELPGGLFLRTAILRREKWPFGCPVAKTEYTSACLMEIPPCTSPPECAPPSLMPYGRRCG